MSWKWSNQFQPPAPLPFSRSSRLQWSKELHDKFVSAVNQLGGASKATPKSIWNIMQVEGLTLFQIKSHLQKYRLGKIGRRFSRRDVVATDGRREVEDDLPENEQMDMEGYNQGSSDMNGDETLETQKYGADVNHLVESGKPPLTMEKDIGGTENPNHGDPNYFPEWSDLLDGDYIMTHNSSTFSSFFDEVANFPNIEDDFMNDYDI